MIQATELRIGNWVNLCFEHKSGWYYARVTEILLGNRINTDTKDSGGKIYYYEPIPLTPEILEKAGFEYDMIVYSIEGMLVGGADSNGYWPIWLHGLHNGITLTVKYLHQLQNAYYVITGTELQIEF